MRSLSWMRVMLKGYCGCKHSITRNDHCIKCGGRTFETETRPCRDCIHYQTYDCGWSYCNKYEMTVTRTMKVYYKTETGTCFEEKSEDVLIQCY